MKAFVLKILCVELLLIVENYLLMFQFWWYYIFFCFIPGDICMKMKIDAGESVCLFHSKPYPDMQ